MGKRLIGSEWELWGFISSVIEKGQLSFGKFSEGGIGQRNVT